jgi:hypothetical protein
MRRNLKANVIIFALWQLQATFSPEPVINTIKTALFKCLFFPILLCSKCKALATVKVQRNPHLLLLVPMLLFILLCVFTFPSAYKSIIKAYLPPLHPASLCHSYLNLRLPKSASVSAFCPATCSTLRVFWTYWQGCSVQPMAHHFLLNNGVRRVHPSLPTVASWSDCPLSYCFLPVS